MIRQAFLMVCVLVLATTAVSAQKPGPKKPDTSSGSTMEIVVEHNGTKTEIKSSVFKSHDGYAMKQPDGKLMLFYGASNSMDEESFSFSGNVSGVSTGIYPMGGENSKATWNLTATAIKGATMLLPQEGGTVEITSSPVVGGFVVGKFHAKCQAVMESGTIEEFDVSGSFKLVRR